MHGLRPVAARQTQDFSGAANVGRLQLRIRVDEVHYRAGVEDQTYLAGQGVEVPLVQAEQGFSEVSPDGYDTLRPFGFPQPVAPQVGLDRLHPASVPARPDEAVDAGVSAREQPVEQEGTEKACYPRKEHVARVMQGRRTVSGGLRDYPRVEDGLGGEILRVRHPSRCPVAL